MLSDRCLCGHIRMYMHMYTLYIYIYIFIYLFIFISILLEEKADKVLPEDAGGHPLVFRSLPEKGAGHWPHNYSVSLRYMWALSPKP